MSWTEGIIHISNNFSICDGYLGIFTFILFVLFIIAFILFAGLVMYFAVDTINELKE
jgi:hypothetical protein